MLLPFRAADGFGMDKPGGRACHHLSGDDLCRIHARLEESGWPGCAAYDCRGAGQQVSQVTYAGVSWRDQGDVAEMAAVFSVMRLLHEMLVQLEGSSDAALHARIVGLTRCSADQLLALDLDELQQQVVAALG